MLLIPRSCSCCCRHLKTAAASTTRTKIAARYDRSVTPRFPKRRGEYLFGVAPCLAVLRAKRRQIYNIFLWEGVTTNKAYLRRAAVEELQSYAERKELTIHTESKAVLERLSGKRPHQGMVLDVEPLKYSKLDPKHYAISQAAKQQRPPVWLALDEVQDPMNFGAVLRCAYFLGVDRVVATAKNSCALSPVVSKASSGALELMQVYSVGNMTEFLKDAGERGWHVLGTCSLDKQRQKRVPVIDCYDYTLQGPTILVMGNEGQGIQSSVEHVCSGMLTIRPLRTLPTGFDSLNVSVATGILLHTLKRTPHTVRQ